MSLASTRMGTVRAIATFLVGIVFAQRSAIGYADGAEKRFSVSDSIGMQHIVDPPPDVYNDDRAAAPIVSPDGHHFLLVTQRGVLAHNTLESTIWLFDRDVVERAASAGQRVVPTRLAMLEAESNTPVICDVRWIDAAHVAFLGKNRRPYQGLYIADLETRSFSAIVEGNEYVTAYDTRGETVAYTTLVFEQSDDVHREEYVDTAGQSISRLLYPIKKDASAAKDIDETSLSVFPNELHIRRAGRDLPLRFQMDGQPLKLFLPILALSPDGGSLVTIAPVHQIPSDWERYRPAIKDLESLRLTQGNSEALQENNPWKASEPVLVDIKTGHAEPLIDAPVGRSLLYIYDAPTKVQWSADGAQLLISNIFLPLNGQLTARDLADRTQAPAIAVLDVRTRDISPVTYLGASPYREVVSSRIVGMRWDSSHRQIILRRMNVNASAAHFVDQTFRYSHGAWGTTRESRAAQGYNVGGNRHVEVDEDLNHPQRLVSREGGSSAALTLWDPNPDVSSMDLGDAKLFRWTDSRGASWTGILAMPPRSALHLPAPLVIQTHGHQENQFFADGMYTTANGGRALTSQGVVVLQMDEPNPSTLRTVENGSAALAGFRGAIEALGRQGIIDPTRVGVIGFSFTCYHVLNALTQAPDLFAAASITDGNDMSYGQYLVLANRDEFQDTAERSIGALPVGDGLEKWKESSPGFNFDKVRAPLIVSALERGTLLTEWEPFAVLTRLHRPVDLIWLKNGNPPHVLVKPAHRLQSQQGSVDWFRFWLQGFEDSAPEKDAQYRRWEKLCDLHVSQNPNRTSWCMRSGAR